LPGRRGCQEALSTAMAIWLIVLFILQLLVGETAGRNSFVTVERSTRVFYALVQFGALLAGYLVLGANRLFGRKFVVLEPKAVRVFVLLSFWSVVATLAMVLGLAAGNDTSYVVGDFYKFALLPLLFTLAYFGIRTERQLWFLLRGLAVVFGAAILVDFVRDYSTIRQGGSFANSATYHIGTLNTLILFLLVSRSGGRWFRRLLWAMAIEICIAIVLLQGFSDYLYLLLALGLFLLYSGNKKFIAGLALAGMLAFVGIVQPFLRAGSPSQLFGASGSYASRKLNSALARGSGSILEEMELLSGDRLGQMAGVLRAYRQSPARLAFGFGMGGELEVLPVTMNWIPLARYHRWTHFIESSFFEVFYRTGLAGLLTFMALLHFCYRRGKRLAAGPHRQFGTFVMVNTVYQFFNLMQATPMEFTWLFLVLPVVGTFVLERAQAGAQQRSAAALAEGRLQRNPGVA
jgi:hypothetical protein